jgi:acyl-CoA reductase-like NAD-dependent aldehyde dehydrogenase
MAVPIFFSNFQTCVSANRFLIQDEIFDVFVEKIRDKIKTLKMGFGMDHSCSLGPLINTAQADKVRHCMFVSRTGFYRSELRPIVNFC